MRTPALIVFVFLAVASCSGIKARTNTFATLADARAAGAISNGWIPEGLPSQSHDLREAHVPDSSKRWGLFEYPPSEEETLRALINPEELSLGGQHCDIPARIEWWPLVLRGDLDGERVAATGLHAYRSRSGDLLFAINWRQGRAYFWSIGG